ncbi:MAG TPA: tetratricopeptide repeat protein [Bryobacteraceae bacterium]|nr:tetratricopeptide repeat protein [Bryobacteraceae bacterium]
MSYAHMKLGRKADAKKHFERYLEIFPASPKAAEIKALLPSL